MKEEFFGDEPIEQLRGRLLGGMILIEKDTEKKFDEENWLKSDPISLVINQQMVQLYPTKLRFWEGRTKMLTFNGEKNMAAEMRVESNLTRSYLDCFQEAKGEEKRKKITNSFFQALESLDLFAKQREAIELRRAIENFSQKEKLIAALNEYAGPYSWEDVFFGSYTQPLASVKTPYFTYDNFLHEEIAFESRFRFDGTEKCVALFGSSFATNRKERLDNKGHVILDRAIGLECQNAKKEFTGYALALGDGCGGHFGDHLQDLRISKAAEFGVKELARHLSCYADPESLKKDLPSILELVKSVVQEEGKGEGTTLLGCRVFPDGGNYRLIGLSIGDGMLFGYQRDSGFIPLLNAHQSEAGTAIFPAAYRPFEMQLLDKIVPKDTLIFCLSDGLHDILPYREEEHAYQNQLKYKSRILDEKTIANLFDSLEGELKPQDYLSALIQLGLKELNQTRCNSLNQESIQIGDDVSALCCLLDQQKSTSLLSMITGIWSSMIGSSESES